MKRTRRSRPLTIEHPTLGMLNYRQTQREMARELCARFGARHDFTHHTGGTWIAVYVDQPLEVTTGTVNALREIFDCVMDDDGVFFNSMLELRGIQDYIAYLEASIFLLFSIDHAEILDDVLNFANKHEMKLYVKIGELDDLLQEKM